MEPYPFEFNEAVSTAFDDMARRSIPLYETTIETISQWVLKYYQKHSHIYDIGCSTGNTINAIANTLKSEAIITGIDQSEPMISLAAKKNKHISNQHHIKFICQDALKVNYANSSVVLANYTLQFIDPNRRLSLVSKIYKALKPGGIFIVSEKIKSSDLTIQKKVTEIYEDFKIRSGYSKIEIARKKEALEKVLIPLSQDKYEEIFQRAGFYHSECILRWNNFITIVAFKK